MLSHKYIQKAEKYRAQGKQDLKRGAIAIVVAVVLYASFFVSFWVIELLAVMLALSLRL
jgi:hypothetical protein